MLEQLERLHQDALSQLSPIWDAKQLEEWRVKFMGRKGALAACMEQLGTLPKAERAAAGKLANEVKQALETAYDAKIGAIKQRALSEDGVVFFDLVEDGIEGYNKFIPYQLFPESTYTVSVSTSSFRTKVSVGSNPWSAVPPSHNLATICERYGGGGHARVGAISFALGAVGEARRVAKEIAKELSS